MTDGPAGACAAPLCTTEVLIARGLCRRHYTRWQRTKSLGDDSDRTCKGCSSRFSPTRQDQVYCSRACGTRSAVRRSQGLTSVIPATRRCRWCEQDFQHHDGRRAFCSDECQAIGRRLQDVRSVFGLTIEDYRQLHVRHAGKCGICGGVQTGPKAYLCVDHDHATGRVRGLLCDACNRGIGLLRDDPELLAKAIAYLS